MKLELRIGTVCSGSEEPLYIVKDGIEKPWGGS